jgi:hypothetical protein
VSRDPAPVCRGVALLDEHVPGWEHQINLDTLDLVNTERCVLGQLWLAQHPRTRDRYAAYDKMCKALKLPGIENEIEFGFTVGLSDDGGGRWVWLTKAWKIRRRLRAA